MTARLAELFTFTIPCVHCLPSTFPGGCPGGGLMRRRQFLNLALRARTSHCLSPSVDWTGDSAALGEGELQQVWFLFPGNSWIQDAHTHPEKGRPPDGSSNDLRLQGSAAPNLPPRREQQAPSTSTPHSNPSNHPETNQLRIVPRRTAAQIGTPRHWQTPMFSPSARLRVSPLLDNPERVGVVGPGPPLPPASGGHAPASPSPLPPFPPPTYPLPSRPVCTGHCHVTCHVRASFHHVRDLSNGQEA